MKTLVVDDDPIVCAVMADGLSKLGLRDILIAENGEDAAWLFTENEGEICLVCSDLNMPELDGIEFTEFLAKQIDPPQLIFMSGAHETVRKAAVALAEAGKLDVIGSLSKPVCFAELKKLQSKIFRGIENRKRLRST